MVAIGLPDPTGLPNIHLAARSFAIHDQCALIARASLGRDGCHVGDACLLRREFGSPRDEEFADLGPKSMP